MSWHHFTEHGGDTAKCDGCGCTYADAVNAPRPCRPVRRSL